VRAPEVRSTVETVTVDVPAVVEVKAKLQIGAVPVAASAVCRSVALVAAVFIVTVPVSPSSTVDADCDETRVPPVTSTFHSYVAPADTAANVVGMYSNLTCPFTVPKAALAIDDAEPCVGYSAELLGVPSPAVVSAAFAGTAENPAIANADAATSAMRLKLVFVDIIFLSRKVAIKNFLIAAWPKMPDS
jgi:hypothetical protein